MITGTSYDVHCDMTTESGGWSLLEKAQAGSSALATSGVAQAPSSLQSPTTTGDATVGEAALTSFCASGCELLWKLQDTPSNYQHLRFTSHFFAHWTYNKRYDSHSSSSRWFELSSGGSWYTINGHVNNVHFSTYSDGTSYGDTGWTSPWLTGYQTCTSAPSTQCYFYWHTHSSNQAGHNYLLYFKPIRPPPPSPPSPPPLYYHYYSGGSGIWGQLTYRNLYGTYTPAQCAVMCRDETSFTCTNFFLCGTSGPESSGSSCLLTIAGHVNDQNPACEYYART